MCIRDSARRVAFVKLQQAGDHGLRREKEASTAVGGRLASVWVPRVLAEGRVGSYEYIAFEPLPEGLHRRPASPPIQAITEEVSQALSVLPRPPGTPAHWRPMHGDFAPWNLREMPGGQLSLVDWEDADWAPPKADHVKYLVTVSALNPSDPPRLRGAGEAIDFWQQQLSGDDALVVRDRRLA